MASYAATITSSGITAPAYSDILSGLTGEYLYISPQDQVTNDSMMGQLLGTVALAISDANNMAISTYNNIMPSYATGVALSSLIKLNGLRREVASNSTATVICIGVTGTTINYGAVNDQNGYQWNLPTSVVIGLDGTATVLATCATPGAIFAESGQINIIATPTYQWQSVRNPAASTIGKPVELDAQLRMRQTTSTEISAQAIADSILSVVSNLAGVTGCKVYDNDTDYVSAENIPPHNVAVVAMGGDPTEIATAIARKKTLGTPTYGNISVQVKRPYGWVTINYWEAQAKTLSGRFVIKPKAGYTSQIGIDAVQAISDYVNSLGIGGQAYASEALASGLNNQYFNAISFDFDGNDTAFIPFQSYAYLPVGNVSLVLL